MCVSLRVSNDDLPRGLDGLSRLVYGVRRGRGVRGPRRGVRVGVPKPPTLGLAVRSSVLRRGRPVYESYLRLLVRAAGAVATLMVLAGGG